MFTYHAGGKALAGREVFDSEGLALLLEAALAGVMKRVIMPNTMRDYAGMNT